MKKLKQLKGAKALNKKEQQSINGGAPGQTSGCFSNEADCLNAPCYGTCDIYWIPSNPSGGMDVACWKCNETGWDL